MTKESVIVIIVFNKNILKTLSTLVLISPISIVGIVITKAEEPINIFGNDIDILVSDQIPGLMFLGIVSIILSLFTISVIDYCGIETIDIPRRLLFTVGLVYSEGIVITRLYDPELQLEYGSTLSISLCMITTFSYFCVTRCCRNEN